MNNEPEIPLFLGGAGGAYFLAEPGELVIHLAKYDRHVHDRQTDLRALLVGPDRQVLQEITIPDDGLPVASGPGQPKYVRLSTQVERPGIYALNITIAFDRYGEEAAWGFVTNCKHYLIETSRGHKDARHQEPLELLSPDHPGNICFLPPVGDCTIQATNLAANVKALPVYNVEGTLIHTLQIKEDGTTSYTFPANVHRDAVPWRLHLPAAQATLNIDGLTRWETSDPNQDLSLWTPDPDSFFPFQKYRWLITPYSITTYVHPGERQTASFRVHNNASSKQTIRLNLEFPGDKWPVHLSSTSVELAPGQAEEVTLEATIPESASPESDTFICHLRATPQENPDISTYATLFLKTGIAPAERPLDLPVILKPYRHENHQFGHQPDYPVENQVYFDLENTPFIRTTSGVSTLREGHWITTDLQKILGSPAAMSSTKIAFDTDNDLYLVTRVNQQPTLLRSTDRATTFTSSPIGTTTDQPASFDIEQFSGHNTPDGPPPVVRYTQTEADPERIWRRLNDMELFLPQKDGDGLHPGDPILVSRACIGISQHSGAPSSIVSRGARVHLAWAEATDPKEDVPGVPTFVATYDRETKTLGKPVLIGYGPPANDVHNSPCITMDSRGYLHVLVGTHGRTFKYARSLQPNDAYAGWTQTEDVWPDLRQTYVGLVCDAHDTLHLVFRLGWHNAGPFPVGQSLTLSHQRKPFDSPWEEPRTLVAPPFSEYSVYYHRLTIDRTGHLFLSHDYYSTYWFYRTDHPGKRRTLLTSADRGET
ncbi:MAG: BNR-4 repeat-containing protein [bacterium]|nr:BNR-4 repeat-containing protein [bacterium]